MNTPERVGFSWHALSVGDEALAPEFALVAASGDLEITSGLSTPDWPWAL